MNKIAQLVSVFALGLTVSMMAHGHLARNKPTSTVHTGDDA